MSLPETSTKSISVGNVTPADIEEFRRGSQTLDSQFLPDVNMGGEQFGHMDSARYDPTPRGINQPDQIPQPYNEPLPVSSQDQPALQTPQPEPDYRQKYGESENEKGEWRRMAMELAQREAQWQAQMADLQNRLLAQQAAPPPPQYQPQPQAPVRLLPHRDRSEMINVGDLEEFAQTELLPALLNMRAGAEDAATARAMKMLPSWDVQPQEETRAILNLRQRYPGFENRFSQTERQQMILDDVRYSRAITNAPPVNGIGPVAPIATPVGRVNGAPLQQAQPVMVDPSRAIRQATYIERAAPVQMSQEPTNQLSRAQQFQAALQQLDLQAKANGKQRASAAEMKLLFERFGIGSVNDFGGQVLTR